MDYPTRFCGYHFPMNEFPMPREPGEKIAKSRYISVRTEENLLERLHDAIPDKAARAQWLRDLVEYGVRKLEGKD